MTTDFGANPAFALRASIRARLAPLAMLGSRHYAEPFEQDKMVKTTSHSADRNALPLSLEWWSIMASNACRWNGDTPLTKFHGGNAEAARLAVAESKRLHFERAREIARNVVARASAFEGRQDRVRKRRFFDTPSINVRQVLWDQSEGRCHYCGWAMIRKPNVPTSFTIDHVIPRCRGGSNDAGNLVAACASCNHEKGSLTGAEYRDILAARQSERTGA